MSRIREKLGTLRVKFSVITFFTYLFLVSSIFIACASRYDKGILEVYENQGNEILGIAAREINADHIPDYVRGDEYLDEYEKTRERLNTYAENFKSIYYLYALIPNEDGLNATILFDAKVEHDTPQKLGESYRLEKGAIKNIEKIRSGKVAEAFIDRSKWGYLLTCIRPLADSEGTIQGYLFLDFNVDRIRSNTNRFFVGLFLIVLAIMVCITYWGISTVSIRITEPIEKMYKCLSGFKYSSDFDRQENIRKLKELNINTNAEITSLYHALIKTNEDSYNYLHDFQTATEKLDIAKEKAYNDALTGLHNKNAYDDKLKKLQELLDQHQPVRAAFIMVDINNLKYVNDTFGHRKGDQYIRGCCRILSEVCKTSTIYRIGGDEFVILLQDRDYENRHEILEHLKKSYESTYNDGSNQPWEQYSASVGMSEIKEDDTKISDVFKRADSEMYKAKSEFRLMHGRYR